MWSSVPATHPRERGEKKSSPHFPSPLVGSPHRRGEKLKSLLALGFQAGSPLRVRGKILSYPGRNSAPRITPASAGKRQARSCGSREPRDHPAGTGKRSGRSRSVRGTQDHPRGCGKKKWIYTQPPCAQGSPPQVRGKGPIHRNVKKSWRITPADAGKRHRLQGVGADAQDHPRGCGEKKASAPWSTTV